MKEAIGGVFTLQIILVFIVLVNAYLAYSVNYTRAFRVKNGIISIIEEYEGLTEEAKEEIDDYVKDMRYRVSSNVINSGTLARRGMDVSDCVINNGYCTKCTASSDEDATSDGYRGVYYSVVTFVNVDIPILNKILPLGSWLQVSGETKAIYSPNGCPNY